jgi:hypothetical protein
VEPTGDGISVHVDATTERRDRTTAKSAAQRAPIGT